jgi:chitinase
LTTQYNIDSSVSYANNNKEKLFVCYLTNWSQYRPSGGTFFPENVDPNLCTHIVYAFAKVVGDNIEPYEWNDADSAWSKGY